MTHPDPAVDPQAAFEAMVERAITLIDVTFMQNEMDAKDDERDLLIAGAHIGIAAATEYFKEFPQDVPR